MSLFMNRTARVRNHFITGEIFLRDDSSADDEFLVYTTELDWRNNKRRRSCVPAGVYELRPHPWSEQKFRLVNEDLGIYSEKTMPIEMRDQTRDQINIEVANDPRQLLGCIAVGMGMGRVKTVKMSHYFGVTNSRGGMKRLLATVQEYDINKIEISWADLRGVEDETPDT